MGDPSDVTILGLLIRWFPILLLIGVWGFFLFRTKHSTPPPDYWEEQRRIGRETLESRRETNRLLAELTAKLEC